MSLDAFTLLRPWWLLAPPLILALAILARSRGDLGDWRRAIDAPLLAGDLAHLLDPAEGEGHAGAGAKGLNHVQIVKAVGIEGFQMG